MRHRGWIYGVYICPEDRKQGIASRLAQEVIALVSGTQVEQVHLSVVTENSAAVQLYKSLGFKTYGTDPRVLRVNGKDYDEDLMVLFLKDVKPR